MTAGTYSRGTWTALALIASGVIVTLFFATQIRSRAEQVTDALAQMPLVVVADVPTDGATARVEGRVQLVGSGMVAPVSGEQCAFYEIELDGIGDGTRLHRKAQGRDFWLVDASGTALVRLESAMVAPGSGMIGAMVAIDEARCRQGALAELAVDRQDAVLRLLGERVPDGALGEVSYRECVLAADATATVAGAVLPGRLPGRGGRERVLLAATPTQPLYIAVAGRP